MRSVRRPLIALAAISALVIGIAACAPAKVRPDARSARAPADKAPRYYVSLGDSLAQGVQPTASGTSLPTASGYPDRIFSALRAHDPSWRLVKLGCSGETTHTMIAGGICQYPDGSQLDQADQFLRTHRGQIGLITIDIGANDPNSCVYGALSLRSLARCIGGSITNTEADLRHIMTDVRAAAGGNVPILAMSYYVPELAGWLHGKVGEAIAVLTERLVAWYNAKLTDIYRHYDAHIANVFGAFDSSDFSQRVQVPGHGLLPKNVALICQWTWACASHPRGPNEHANNSGYSAIAQAFLQADPQLLR